MSNYACLYQKFLIKNDILTDAQVGLVFLLVQGCFYVGEIIGLYLCRSGNIVLWLSVYRIDANGVFPDKFSPLRSFILLSLAISPISVTLTFAVSELHVVTFF